METLAGYVERLTYQNPENGFTVAKLKAKKHRDLVCIVGDMPTVQPGESVRLLGFWKNDSQYGYQFDVKDFKTERPSDVVAIQKYLGSGLIKGIGPVFAGRIVKEFGSKP